MNQYYLELLDLCVLLQAPMPIQISQSVAPFLCESPLKTADCTINIQFGEKLLQPTGEAQWHGPECYEHREEGVWTFHCLKPYEKPFAVTKISPDGNIQITVHPDFADCFSGTSGIFNRIGFENLLLRHKALLLHASLIEYAHQGIAFTGPSGVGKSTQADLWQNRFSANIINGDRAALRKTDAGWFAYGSPHAGTSGIYKNEKAPLSAIVVLRQAKKNSLRRLSGGEAMAAVWPEISARRWDGAFVAEASALCVELLEDVPVYLLECLPEEGAAQLLKEGLSL